VSKDVIELGPYKVERRMGVGPLVIMSGYYQDRLVGTVTTTADRWGRLEALAEAWAELPEDEQRECLAKHGFPV
jgi:hypothetical protein